MDKLSQRYCAMLGGVYFIVAKKRVLSMTPIKPSWKKLPLKSSLIVTKPKSSPSQSITLKSKLSKSKISNNI